MEARRTRCQALTPPGCRMIHFDTNFLMQTVVPSSPAQEEFRAWTHAREHCNASGLAGAESWSAPTELFLQPPIRL
jgi:hypothetical protein